MAINVKTLGTRTISGAVFVILLLGSVLWNYVSFSLFFFVIALLALQEFYKIAHHLGAKPYRGVGFLSGICLYLGFVNGALVANESLADLSRFFTGLLLLIPLLVLSTALFSKRQYPIQNSLFTLGGILYAVLPFALMHRLVLQGADYLPNYQPVKLIGIIFLIWINDTFAYLGGSLFGKNKMIERISPGKTWEGTVFGVLVAFACSFLIKNYLDANHANYWPILGIVVPILATVGDLVESMLKRQAGVKDSGNLMPGHGGALDRFDSLLFVTPCVTVFFYYL